MMLVKTLRCLAIAVVTVVGLATSASATPIQWNFNNVQFLGPGCPTFCKNNTLTGFFTYDANTSLVSHFDVLVTGTNTLADYEYKSADLGGIDIGFYTLGAPPSVNFGSGAVPPSIPSFAHYMNLQLAAPLTNAGGTVNLLGASTTCPGCGQLISGRVAAAVPEPATLTLLGTALAGLAVRRRRRK